MHRKLIFLSVILLFSTLSSRGAEEKRPLDITSDEVEYSKAKGEEVVIFIGHVVAVQGTTTLKSDKLELFPNENKAVATGHSWMRDEKEKVVLTGEKIEYYHDKGYGIATGKPRLVNEKENLVLTGKKMEISLPRDSLKVTGKARLVRNDMVATCKVLDYFNKERKVILTGDSRIREKKNLAAGDKITFFVDEYRIVIEGRARIKFMSQEKK